jgi:uncharacterized membrane protein
MKRPVIRPAQDAFDYLLEAIGFIALLLLIGLPLYYYGQLPESIPRHFGADGQPDAYSSKAIIWVLPLVGLAMYLGMYWLGKHPHSYNYPQGITPENAQRQYAIATRMVRTLKVVIASLFAYIIYATIQVALGNQTGLGSYFLLVFLLLVFAPIAYYLYRAKRAR